jgi:hypothetical protein
MGSSGARGQGSERPTLPWPILWGAALRVPLRALVCRFERRFAGEGGASAGVVWLGAGATRNFRLRPVCAREGGAEVSMGTCSLDSQGQL